MVAERSSGSRLVNASDKLKHAIEVIARIAIHTNTFPRSPVSFADCPLAPRIRQMTYCPNLTRCYRPRRVKTTQRYPLAWQIVSDATLAECNTGTPRRGPNR